MIQEITVNDLNDALQKAFKVSQISIDSVTVGRFGGLPQTVPIGVGGQLTIRFSTTRKIKGFPVITEYKL